MFLRDKCPVHALQFQLVTSADLLEDLDEKLRTKFKQPPLEADDICEKIEAAADVVSTSRHIRAVLKDPDDDRVLECAVEGHADSIVTGDRHLLELKIYQGIPILTIRQFMDAFDAGFSPKV
jgi:putative PIN family toxin of toxin-antitoxin system